MVMHDEEIQRAKKREYEGDKKHIPVGVITAPKLST